MGAGMTTPARIGSVNTPWPQPPKTGQQLEWVLPVLLAEGNLHSYPASPDDDRGNSYFVVAVVKRDSSYAFPLDELRGKRSCHPSFGSLEGWDVPVGALIHRGFIRPRGCDVLTGITLHTPDSREGAGRGTGQE